MKVSKIHKIFIVIIMFILIFMITPVYNSVLTKRAFDKADIVTLGKTLNIVIKEEDIKDYTFVQKNMELSKWKKSEKNNFIDYMKNKDLILESGNYNINQGTKWKKALEIFELE